MDMDIRVIIGSILIQASASGPYRYARFLNNTVRNTMDDKNAIVPIERLATWQDRLETIEQYLKLYKRNVERSVKA